MRRTRIVTLVGAAAVVIGGVVGVAYAQGMGMGHGGMMSMTAMMDHMRQVVGETSQMMGHAENHGMMGQGTMHGQSGTMASNHPMMMDMVQGTDSMAHTMNGLMQNMNTMMGNQKLMEDPASAQHLEQMQRNMNTMMQGFDGFVADVKALQEQQGSN